nr:MAG TPA: hypothetical protein [Caudoviricetes sp.]
MNFKAIDKIIYMWYFIIFTFNRKTQLYLIRLFLFIYNHARINFMQYNFTYDS